MRGESKVSASVTLELPAVAPFDFAHTLRFLGEFQPTRQDHAVTDATVTKAVVLGEQVLGFRAGSVTEHGRTGLRCTLYAEQEPSEAMKAAASDRISFAFSLDDDLSEFNRRALADRFFAPIAKSLWGYHQAKFMTPFENACWAVLAQRAPMPVAATMKRALVTNLCNNIEVDGETYGAFPTPSQLADWDSNDFVAVIRNKRKAEYLYDVTRNFLAVDESFLRTGAHEEVRDWLLSIRGIGPWSASFVMIRGLGRMEQVPPDPAVVRAAEAVYGRTLTEDCFQQLAEGYGAFQGYWAHYLRLGASAGTPAS